MTIRNKPKNYIEHFFSLLMIVVYAAVFYLIWRSTYLPDMNLPYYWKGKLMVAVVYAGMLAFFLKYFDGFSVGIIRVRDVLFNHVSALFVTDIMGYGLIVFLNHGFSNPFPMFCVLLIQCVLTLLLVYLSNRLYYILHDKQPTALLFENEDELRRLDMIPYFNLKYKITKLLHLPVSPEALDRELEGIDVAFVLGSDAFGRNAIIEKCIAAGISIITVPQTGDVMLSGARTSCVGGNIYMRLDKFDCSPLYLVLKRCFDLAAGILTLALLSPLMLIIALCIRIGDGGPAIYRQERLTKDGKSFTLYKFRSMHMDAEDDGIARLASENDDRITPVGRILRRYRLDELPQLYNIVMGDMSVVGPRPERPEISALYESQLPSFPLRLQVKAGLTGYAQVYGRYNTEPHEKLQMDLMYISRMSLFEDAKLILITVKILFSPEATEGVKEGWRTAIYEENFSANSK